MCVPLRGAEGAARRPDGEPLMPPMPPMLTGLLLVVFLVHLVAFALLGLKRRQAYYLALVITFSLLSASMALRLTAPEAILANGVAWHEALRMLAWPAAAVSVGWTLLRLRIRIAARRG
ncbi:hypothetical protein SAMN04488052_103221 [Aquisalimonas asiatica]|uniref:Uncharacterized protein n=1 Tax=Aquisalimonas asiatica TaxID=406100 RepID=A0A1H8SV85_9GAMM|nr:hypothetical protein SAMN04488052_103221 [Aquisalimonas asiatica]